MKWIWDTLWNNPVVVIGVVTLTAVTLLSEWASAPDAVRIGLTVVVAVGGLLVARATVETTQEYRELTPGGHDAD